MSCCVSCAGASASSLKLQEAPVRAAALTEQLSQLSSSDPTAVQRKQLIPAAGAAAFLGLLMLLWPRGQRADAQLAATDAAGGAQAVTATAVRPVAAAVSKASAPVVDAAGMLQPKMAEQILRQWQVRVIVLSLSYTNMLHYLTWCQWCQYRSDSALAALIALSAKGQW